MTSLNILGAGHAYPETVISNAFLAELSPEVAATEIYSITGVKSRYSVLDPSYLRSSKNCDPAQAKAASKITTAKLGAQAAHLALQRAGIPAEKVTLLIGESSTPTDIVPTEGQRIAKELGLKISAYDILSSTASMAAALAAISAWKEEMVPEYVLLVSANAPSQRINYERGIERLYLGDGASACLLSTRNCGKFSLVASDFITDSTRLNSIQCELYSHVSLADGVLAEIAEAEQRMFEHALKSTNWRINDVIWITSQCGTLALRDKFTSLGGGADRWWSNLERNGAMLGASPAAVLSERWEWIVPGQSIILTFAGSGFSSGFVALRAQ